MPAQPSTARGSATRRRILDAAAQEFSDRGLAGARIDRITQHASTNKAQLYGYFGSKDGLFDAVVADSAERITAAVPVDGNDLADWAVRLYDEYLEHPDLVKLATWLRLERQPAGDLFSEVQHRPKVTAIERAQAAGQVRAGDPFDLMTMVIAMSLAWSPSSNVYAATASEPDEVHERRRTLLRACVTAAMAP